MSKMKEAYKTAEIHDLLELNLTEHDKLRESIETLNGTLKEFIDIIKTAAATPEQQFGDKMNTLLKHNEDIARGILLMLELNREHLPRIARQQQRSQP